MTHETPWSVAWTRFGESMGYDSKSRIVDAHGRTVVEIGDGSQDQRAEAEHVAALIVAAVNAYVPPNASVQPTAKAGR